MKPKTLHIPAYGAQVIPYRWTLKKSGFELAHELELGARLEFEPSEPEFLKRTSWIQQHQNQRALLESFAAPLVTDKSLVLFYTPRTPLCDDQRRVLVGAAILTKKHDLTEYDYEGGAAKGRLQAMVWERAIQHSIRPVQNGEGFVGGFVLPYQQLLQLFETDPSLNPADYVAFTPDEALAFLAPDLVRAAVEGRLPRGIGVERLRDAPAEWSLQFEALGLNPQ
jgi:hypothetical protein